MTCLASCCLYPFPFHIGYHEKEGGMCVCVWGGAMIGLICLIADHIGSMKFVLIIRCIQYFQVKPS